MISNAAAPLARLFETYQRALDQPDPSATLPLFAETFLACGPDGAQPVPIAAFAPALTKRKQLFDNLGLHSTRLASLEEIRIHTRYSIARTSWCMIFNAADLPPQEIIVQSSFLVDTQTERILVYLAHQDIFAILRERGILAD